MKKRVLLFMAVLGLAASLSAQSLVELAKQEKARRDSLKGRHVVVIKNADLLRVRKLPAVEVMRVDDYGNALTGEDEQGTLYEQAGSEPEPGVLPSGSGAPSGRRITPSVAPHGPAFAGQESEAEMIASAVPGGPLEAQLAAAKDQVDLLTTKMNALRQQFEYQDAMVPGYVIQQQLDETNQRLLKAQAQQARIEARMAKGGSARKAPGESER